jgi:hypothetical protein
VEGLLRSSFGSGAGDVPLLNALKGAILASKPRRVAAETMPDANAIPVIDLGPYLAGNRGRSTAPRPSCAMR